MNQGKADFYFIHYGAFPIALALAGAVGMLLAEQIVFVALTVFGAGGLAAGLWAGKKRKQPLNALLFPLLYTLGLWALFMLVTEGSYVSGAWVWFCTLHLPFAPAYLFPSLYGIGFLFPAIPVLYELAFLTGFLVRQRSLNLQSARKTAAVGIAVLLCAGTGAYVMWERAQTVLPSHGFDYEGGNSSTDLTPYNVTNPKNILPRLTEKATFTIDTRQRMLTLDGAEAAFPVYSAFAQAVYKNANQNSNFITFTNTIFAYERLIRGEADIYFGAEPSTAQRKMAEEAGVELVMTPIAKEAFVFFTHQRNPVQNLSTKQIQSIYGGKTTNWKQVGGDNRRILAFQRPENSGSQTWLQKVMDGQTIMTLVKEEVPAGMGALWQLCAITPFRAL